MELSCLNFIIQTVESFIPLSDQPVNRHRMENAEVKIEVPDGWKVQYKQFYHWDYQPVFSDNKAVCMVGEVPQNTHKVAGFTSVCQMNWQEARRA